MVPWCWRSSCIYAMRFRTGEQHIGSSFKAMANKSTISPPYTRQISSNAWLWRDHSVKITLWRLNKSATFLFFLGSTLLTSLCSESLPTALLPDYTEDRWCLCWLTQASTGKLPNVRTIKWSMTLLECTEGLLNNPYLPNVGVGVHILFHPLP